MVERIYYEVSWMPLLCGKEYGMQPCKRYTRLLACCLTVVVDEMLEVPATLLLSMWDAT